jgi:hypothetical protein
MHYIGASAFIIYLHINHHMICITKSNIIWSSALHHMANRNI